MQEEVAKEFGIPVQFQRFWVWAKRQNHTYRPNRPLTPQEEAQLVSKIFGHTQFYHQEDHLFYVAILISFGLLLLGI